MANNKNGDIDWDSLINELETGFQEEEADEEDFTFAEYEAIHNPAMAASRNKEESKPGIKIDVKPNDSVASVDITEEEIQENAYRILPDERVYRSILLEIFTKEQVIRLLKISRTFSVSNNKKIEAINDLLKEWEIDYSPLGGGTNRWAAMVDGYVVKIACDQDGKIDNQREFIYSLDLQPAVIKAYETYADGMATVFEYVELFTIDDFWANQDKMREILRTIAERGFMIGDVGITTKNYVNWGFRDDGSVVILDYAYIYSVKFKQFECGCVPGSLLYYDNDFNDLICPTCGKKYPFRYIRQRITEKDQEAEIGNLLEKGYVLHSPEEKHKVNPKWIYGATYAIKQKLVKERLKRGNLFFENEEPEENDDDILSSEEVFDSVRNGSMDKYLKSIYVSQK